MAVQVGGDFGQATAGVEVAAANRLQEGPAAGQLLNQQRPMCDWSAAWQTVWKL